MAKGNPHPTGWKNSPVANPTVGCDIEEGDNSRYIRHALNFFNLPPVDISDAKQVEERITWYFSKCIEDDMKPTVAGMANALGVDRHTLQHWAKGITRPDTHLALIKNAYNFLEQLWEQNMASGKINPVAGVWLSKNNFGYRDVVEIQASQNATVTDLNAEEVKKRYEELPED